jgi:hypothetical protein
MEVEIQPTARELLAIIAILWAENDSLRERLGSGGTIRFTQRMFTNEDLVRGAQLCLKAVVKTSGSIVVTMES